MQIEAGPPLPLCSGRVGSPGTSEAQQDISEDREAVLRVLPDPEAVLSEQSSECFQAWWMKLAPESQL
jgi:hypothetical protein